MPKIAVKINFNKKLLSLLEVVLFLFSYDFSLSQTYSTKVIDGNSVDWNTGEKIYSNGSDEVYLSWDDTYLYVMFSNGFNAIDDRLNIGIDVDPGSNNNGTSNTATFSGISFSGYLTPDYIVQSLANTALSVYPRSGPGWGPGTDIYSAGTNLWRVANLAEIRIPRTNIALSSTTTAFGLYFWLSNSSDINYTVFGGDNPISGIQRTEVVWSNSGTGVIINTAMSFDYNSAETRIMGSTGTLPSIRNLYTNNNTLSTPATPLAISGNVTIGSSSGLTLSGTIGADISIGGDFTNNGIFTHNNRVVTFDGSTAQTIAGFFNNASGNITNRFPFLTVANTATYPVGVTAGVSINAGTNGQASFVINAGSLFNQTAGTLTISAGAIGNVNGYLRNSMASVTNSGSLNFNSGSYYEHNYTTSSGTIPPATWNNGSTCKIIGYTTFAGPLTGGNGFAQSFSDFEWACASQSTSVNWQMNLITSLSIQRDLIISNTGSAANGLRLSSSGSYTLNIGRNFTINSTNGNTKFDISNGGSGIINIAGNFSISQPANTALFTLSGGTGTILFNNNAGVQTFSQTGSNTSITNGITWNVGNGSTTNTVQLISNINLGSGSLSSFTILNGAKLDFQTYMLQGTNVQFIANPGATLITGNTDAGGALVVSGASGSVRTTGARTFTNAGVNYTFNGAAAQNTGNAIGVATSIGSLTISNGSNVSLNATTVIAAAVTLNNGRLKLGAFNLTIPFSAAITNISSTRFIETDGAGELRIPVVTGSAILFPVGRGTEYMPATFNFSSNTDATNLHVRAITPRNSNDITATDYINNRWWSTDLSVNSGEYAYSAQYTYFAGDVVGNIGNIKLNRWNGSSWAALSGSSASGSTLSSGNITDGDGSLAGAQWVGRTTTASTAYTWINNSGGSWTTNSNWSPAGIPGSGDEVLFNGASTFTVTNVPTGITLNKLTIGGTVKMTWQPSSAGTVNIGNGMSPQFTMASGTTLTIDGTAGGIALNLNILSGNTAQLDGTIILRRGAQRLTANTASSVLFRSGSRFTAGLTGESPTYSGNPFGSTGTSNVIVFQSGSVFESFAGANPFGLVQPSSRVIFQTGSTYKHSSNLAISSLGRTYANFEYNQNSSSASLNASTAAMTMDNLTVMQGILNLDLLGTPGHAIKGNITIQPGATLSIAPTGAGTINLSGASQQVISGGGTFTTNINSLINVLNSSTPGISLQQDVSINGNITVTPGARFNAKDEYKVSGSGSFNLNSSGILGIGSIYGITNSSQGAAGGNIQTSIRNYHSGGNYYYNGSLNQATGDGLPSTVTGSLSIANTGTNPNDIVALTTSNTIVNTLNLASGRFAAGSGQTIKIAAGGNVYGNGYNSYLGNQVWNAGTGGTIECTGAGTIRGSNLKLFNVTIGNSGAGVDFTDNSTIYNYFQINSSGALKLNAPTYAAGSTLIYNTGDSYNRGIEWGQAIPLGAAYPHHVIIQNGTTLNLASPGTPPALETGGDLIIGYGNQNGILNMNAATIPLVIKGNLLIGNASTGSSQLNLSTVSGADLWLYGNFTRNGSNLYNDNGRAIYFKGSDNASINTPNITITPGEATLIFSSMLVEKNLGTKQITLNCPVGISDEITLTRGVIVSNQVNLLIINSTSPSAVINGSATSYVSGPIRRYTSSSAAGTYRFPVGNASNNSYKPIILTTVHSLSGSTFFTGEYKNANPFFGADAFLSILLGIQNNEYWQLDRSDGATTTATVMLTYSDPGNNYWRDAVGNTVTPCENCNVAIVKRNNGSGAGTWDFTTSAVNFAASGASPQARHFTDVNGDIISGEVSSFGPLTFGYGYNIILPVKPVFFSGRLHGTEGRLEWQVSNAESLEYFEVEHSNNGRNFKKLAEIGSTGPGNYNYVHLALNAGANFYRLKVTSKNGSSFFSQVLMLTYGEVKTRIIGLKANPVICDLTPIIFSASEQQANATVTDISGRFFTVPGTSLTTGQNQWRINTAMLPSSGLYFIVIKTTDGGQATLKFIKQ